MAKKQGIDALLERLPDFRHSPKATWWTRAEREHPDFCKEIAEVVDRFNSGDPLVKRKLATLEALKVWLADLLNERGVRVSPNSIGEWARNRRRANHG